MTGKGTHARLRPTMHAATTITEVDEPDSTPAFMARCRAELSDLLEPNPLIYWTDLSACVLIGYGALFVATCDIALWQRLGVGIVAVFALFRIVSFIHELSHLHYQQMKGFLSTWNALVGIPFLLP